VVEALHEIASAGGGRAALLGAVRRATSGLLALRSAAGPPATTAALRKARRARQRRAVRPGWGKLLGERADCFSACTRARSVSPHPMRAQDAGLVWQCNGLYAIMRAWRA